MRVRPDNGRMMSIAKKGEYDAGNKERRFEEED